MIRSRPTPQNIQFHEKYTVPWQIYAYLFCFYIFSWKYMLICMILYIFKKIKCLFISFLYISIKIDACLYYVLYLFLKNTCLFVLFYIYIFSWKYMLIWKRLENYANKYVNNKELFWKLYKLLLEVCE